MSLKEELELKEEETEEKQANYMAYGMSLGILVGSIGMAVLAMYDQIAWGGMSVGIGMLGGMLIGMGISKKK